MTPSEIRVFTLPGFLGVPSDWKAVLNGMRHIRHIPCCVYDDHLPRPEEGIWAWSRAFNQYVEDHYGQPNPQQSNVLLGYSLGGRLAMHALISKSSLWSSGVLVSAHPGLDWHKERLQRQQKDKEWANKFLSDSWDIAMRAWNAQAIFKHDRHIFMRNEKDYNRTLLASTLTHWSLASQANLRLAIQKIRLPIFWVAGELDTTFSSIAKQLRFEHSSSKVWIAPSTGHRVPWHQFEVFNQMFSQFLENSIYHRKGALYS